MVCVCAKVSAVLVDCWDRGVGLKRGVRCRRYVVSSERGIDVSLCGYIGMEGFDPGC